MDALHQPVDQIWDLRQGDADDNRTSPYGRGWRHIVISTALEFNYLTATVAFFAIVIVPALVVGLVPPLALAYGQYKLDATSTLFSHPVAAVSSIAVLLGVALWIGRPLLSMAIDSLWHLH